MEEPRQIINPLRLMYHDESDGTNGNLSEGEEDSFDDSLRDGDDNSETSSYDSEEDEEEWLRRLDREIRNIESLEQMNTFLRGRVQCDGRLDLEPLVGGFDTRERQQLFVQALEQQKHLIRSVQVPLTMTDFPFLEEVWGFFETSSALHVCGIVGGIMDNHAINFLQRLFRSFARNRNGLRKEITFTEIRSDNSSLDDPSWNGIAETIAVFDALQILRCRLCPGRLLWWIMNGLVSNNGVQSVEISPGMDWSSHMDVCASMKTFVQSSKSLLTLDLHQITLIGLECLAEAVAQSRSLRSMHISMCSSMRSPLEVDRWIAAFCTLIRNLQVTVDLDVQCMRFTPTGYQAFCAAVRESTRIRELKLIGWAFSRDQNSLDLVEVLAHHRALEFLSVTGMETISANSERLRNVLNQTAVQRLALNACRLNDIHVSHLLASLQHNRTLRELQFAARDLGLKTMAQLPDTFAENTTLKKLVIDCPSIHREFLSVLGRALAKNSCRVQSVCLDGMQMVSPADLDGFFNGIRRSHELRSLYFSCIQFKEEHLNIIAAHLPNIENLTELSMPWPRRLAFSEAFSQALNNNSSLEAVHIGIHPSARLSALARAYTTRNRLQKLKLQGLKEDMWPTAFAKALGLSPSGLFLGLKLLACDLTWPLPRKRKAAIHPSRKYELLATPKDV